MRQSIPWSEDPSSHQAWRHYGTVADTRHVVLVHLARFIWRNESLVRYPSSVITHEVSDGLNLNSWLPSAMNCASMTSGYVDILLMGAAGALNENQLHFLDIVRTNTERLSVLVNDCWISPASKQAGSAFSLQSADLREMANDVIVDITRRSQEENKPMTFTLDAPDELPLVTATSSGSARFLGPGDNGYHYTPRTGISPFTCSRRMAQFRSMWKMMALSGFG